MRTWQLTFSEVLIRGHFGNEISVEKISTPVEKRSQDEARLSTSWGHAERRRQCAATGTLPRPLHVQRRGACWQKRPARHLHTLGMMPKRQDAVAQGRRPAPYQIAKGPCLHG